jgi:uncharacterized protein YkwD
VSKLTTVLVVIILIIVVGWAASSYFTDVPVQTTVDSSTVSTSQSPLPVNWLSDTPVIVGNFSKIDYPPDYSALANFTLSVINADRASAGLTAVTLSSVASGQQHADSMAYFGYFSHWDTQGYKPYMRYTLLGGTGSVSENVALDYCTTSPPGTAQPVAATCSLQTVENALSGSEWLMMNNDSTCCNNGHRANILDPLHDQVSVGVAFNSTTVYLVEDFEDSYISSESLQLSAGTVTFQGAMQQQESGWMRSAAGSEIAVYYDPTPTNISVSQLDQLTACDQYNELSEPASCQYQGAYDSGTQVSTVFAPCPLQYVCNSASNYTYAQTWQANSGSFDIVFSLGALEAAHGSGVYTFYLWPAEATPEPITSLSVFVTDG